MISYIVYRYEWFEECPDDITPLEEFTNANEALDLADKLNAGIPEDINIRFNVVIRRL